MSTKKCPNCKATIQEESTICEWCNFVMSKDGSDSIESLSHDIEETLKLAHALPQNNILSTFKKNAKLSMPVFAISAFILAYKVSAWMILPGVFFLIYAISSIFRKSEEEVNQLQLLKAEFDSKLNQFDKLYGKDNNYKNQVQIYRNNWRDVLQVQRKSKLFEWVAYGIIATLFLVVFLIPEPKSNKEIKERLNQEESLIIKDIEVFLQNNKLDSAQNLLVQLKNESTIITAKSMIQIAECKQKANEVQKEIDSKNYENAANKLSKIVWTKKSLNYDAEVIEENFFKQFVTLKKELNDMLPKELKVKMEDEFDFN